MKNSSAPSSPPEVGATLQKLRLKRGLTLDDLSRAAGVSKSMLSQIEREKANPTIAVTWRLANALGIGIEELLSSEPEDVERSTSWNHTRHPPCPAIMRGICCASWAPWNWPGNMNGMN